MEGEDLEMLSSMASVEEHSWHNEVSILCDIFNLNQNSNYEAATATAVLGNSYIHSKFCLPKQCNPF